MSDPDKSFESFKQICLDFKSFCDTHGSVSEADTRVKLIDRVLKEVLGWPERLISREDHTQGVNIGYSDYQLLVNESPYIVVEAKRQGKSFVLPEAAGRRRLKINGILQTSDEFMSALTQVRQYCVDDILLTMPLQQTVIRG